MERFVSQHLVLLEKERETEIEETRILTEKLPAKELQRRGVCLLKLTVGGRRTGLYGRLVVQFEPSGLATDLPSHNLSPGDIVGLSLTQSEGVAEQLASGLVTKVFQTGIHVAFDDGQHGQDILSLADDDQYKLTKLANDVTYKRLKKALTNLSKYHPGPASQLIQVLFDEAELSSPDREPDLEFRNANLDESQREAVKFALSQREVAVIHGPPGTGKTTTVIEIILQAVRQGRKILACAPSNIAVDNLVERLVSEKQRIVRLGHPARLLPHIQKYSLDAILSSTDESKLVDDVRKDLDKTLVALRKTRDKGEKQKLREDMKFLRKELVQREDKATREILKRADVILVTLTSASRDGPLKLLDDEHFDLVVIDECSQAVEAACWIALVRARRCILAGDHLQLPPTILSQEAARNGLAVTLMERILKLHGDKIMRMLTVQYRMHELIMRWSSDKLYEGKLVAHASVQSHLLRDMAGVADCEETSTPLLLLDTAGCELRELDLPEEISKGNEGEADVAAIHVEKLISSGVSPEDIAVIAPYNLQVELLRLRLSSKYPKLEIKSVDGFQGREKEAVVISLVRSNPRGEVGFLAENRRINVAITRARRHLAVVCDSETVGHNDFLGSLVDYMMTNGEVQTAQVFVEAGQVHQNRVRPEHLDGLMSMSSVSQDKGARPKAIRKERKPKPSRKESADKIHHPDSHTRKRHESETEEKVTELQKLLDGFVANPSQDVLDFPVTLTSHERLLLHELAEKMGLLHISKGSGDERYITISKPGARSENEAVTSTTESKEAVKPVMVKNSSIQRETTDSRTLDKSENHMLSYEDLQQTDSGFVKCESSVQKNSQTLVCSHCGKDVIKANFQLHEIHCAKKQKEKSKTESGSTVTSGQQTTSAKKKPVSHQKAVASRLDKIDSDDFDALISTVQKMDSLCRFKKCKQSTLIMGQMCPYCQRRFCLEHHIPEVHGCSDAARAHMRAIISKEGVLYRGSGTPSKNIDPSKKANLQKKLEKKLDTMSDKRSGKKSKK